jgi:hypothetical protein
LREKIAFALSEMDKTAEIQKDKQGNIIYDSTTKDTELIKLNMDVEEYFKKEVYPHVPDARYVYEYGEEGKLPLFPGKQSSAALSKKKSAPSFPLPGISTSTKNRKRPMCCWSGLWRWKGLLARR